jgi:hypothetical protein
MIVELLRRGMIKPPSADWMGLATGAGGWRILFTLRKTESAFECLELFELLELLELLEDIMECRGRSLQRSVFSSMLISRGLK